MVKRGPWVLLALLVAGCPDDIGRGSSQAVVVGLLAPSDLAVEYDGGSRIVLRWSDHSTNETGYRLEMSATPYESPTIGDVRYMPPNETSIVYPTFPNTTYYFRVFATTATRESDPSNVCVAYTPNVPAQPGGVDARPHTSSEIALSWSDVSGETSYVVERSLDAGATWFPAGSLPPDATSFISGGLAPDSEVAHRIVAVSGFGRSTPSDPAFAQTTTASMTFVTLPMVGNYGLYTSCAVEAGGREHVACYDVVNSNVLYSTRQFPGEFVTTTVDAGPGGLEDVGGDGTGIAVESTGKVHIVAHDRTNDTLRYATNATGAWKAVTLDSYPSGAQPRIICGRNSDHLHATYLESFGGTYGNLVRYAYRYPGDPWKTYAGTVRSVPGARHGLAQQDTFRPFLAAIDQTGLIHAWKGGDPFGVTMPWFPYGSIASPTPQVGDTFLAGDGQGRYHLVFHERSTASLYYAELRPAGTELEIFESQPGMDVGRFCCVGVESLTGRLHLAYYDATRQDLRYARKDPGGPWVRRIIDAIGDVGSHASIAVDGSGKVVIAYRDETNRRLRVATGKP